MPISLTILQVFCLVDFSFFKFILKNAHFVNILVNFWVLWKNVENFHISEFFFENFTLTIFINALDPDPDPGSGSETLVNILFLLPTCIGKSEIQQSNSSHAWFLL